MHQAPPINMELEAQPLGALAHKVSILAGIVGLAGLGIAVGLSKMGEGASERFYHAYLVSFCFFLSLSLGALFFVILQYLTRSGWSVVVRRVAEVTASNVLLLAVLAVPVMLGANHLYEWTVTNRVMEDDLLQWKEPFLNLRFFLLRLAIYFVVWVGLSRFYLGHSTRQDRQTDPRLTLRLQRWSGPAMLLYAMTVTFAAFDLLMSLDPHWYSTIFGVYFFSGAVVGFFAWQAVVLLLLQKAGRLQQAVTAEHYHDTGKLVFAFVVFWAYIAFSQYLLIWYANIPEETVWYLRRQNGNWALVSIVLLVGHFFLPFFALMSRHPKRRRMMLAVGAVWVLLMHWVDHFWLVMPEFAADGVVPLGLMELACFVGLGGCFVAGVSWGFRNRAVAPIGDPRLPESLAFENV
ncbi:MAG: hypothetical protein HJJLKODD_01880 [Phycisphaerae bacterium]|nr:hypothetical protein [Phycisphaerae bacterium]